MFRSMENCNYCNSLELLYMHIYVFLLIFLLSIFSSLFIYFTHRKKIIEVLIKSVLKMNIKIIFDFIVIFFH